MDECSPKNKVLWDTYYHYSKNRESKKIDKNEKLWISNKLIRDYNDQQNQINIFMVCQMLVQAMTENKREARWQLREHS